MRRRWRYGEYYGRIQDSFPAGPPIVLIDPVILIPSDHYLLVSMTICSPIVPFNFPPCSQFALTPGGLMDCAYDNDVANEVMVDGVEFSSGI